jgi:hypothetical protein
MQTFRQGGAKLLYTVPIAYRGSLQGLVVFYWRQLDKTADHAALENFIRRIIGHITMILGRKDTYANIQRLSLYDLLTGLANRRMFVLRPRTRNQQNAPHRQTPQPAHDRHRLLQNHQRHPRPTPPATPCSSSSAP